MQVIYLLAAIRIAIDDQPITALCDALLPGEIARHDEHVSDQRFILVDNVVGGGDGFVRDNQYMYGGRGSDVQKSDHARIAMEHRRRQITADDFLKKRRHFNASET